MLFQEELTRNSSNISVDHYLLLQKYARLYYLERRITQPTISHVVRGLIARWADSIKKIEEWSKVNSQKQESRTPSPQPTSVSMTQRGQDYSISESLPPTEEIS